jgi:hypothetical protein
MPATPPTGAPPAPHGWAPPAAPGWAPPPEQRGRSKRQPILVALLVVAIGYGGFLGAKAIVDARAGGLGDFDPSALAWQTHQDPSGRFTVDMPGPSTVEPARADEPATVSTDGVVSVGVVHGPLGSGETMIDLATFTDGLTVQLKESFHIERAVVRHTSEKATPDGRALLADFEGIMEGTPIAGVTEIRAEASLMFVIVTVGVLEERADVAAVQDRVSSSLVVG